MAFVNFVDNYWVILIIAFAKNDVPYHIDHIALRQNYLTMIYGS